MKERGAKQYSDKWLWFLVCAVVAIFSDILPARATDAPTVSQDIIKAKSASGTLEARPKNYYQLLSAADVTVCRTLLDSLNKGYSPTQEQMNVGENPNLTTELFLNTDLQIAWHRKQIVDRDMPKDISKQVVDYATADLANNGTPLFVYRWAFYGMSRLLDVIFLAHELFPEFTNEDPLTPSIIKKLSGPQNENELHINPKTAPGIWNGGIYPLDDDFDINVVRVDERVFLLAVNALEAARAEYRGAAPRIYVLQYQPNRTLTVVCRFRGKF